MLSLKNLVQFLNFAMIVSSALMVWKGLFVLSGTGRSSIKNNRLVLDFSESPIVVVLSGSMEPAFYRGDLLFLYHDRKVNLVVSILLIKLYLIRNQLKLARL